MKNSAAAHFRSIHHSGRANGPVVSDALQAIRARMQSLSNSAASVERKTGVTNARLFLLQQIRRLERAPAAATSKVLQALRRLDPNELRALSKGVLALGHELGVTDGRPSILFERDGTGPTVTLRQREPNRARPHPGTQSSVDELLKEDMDNL